MSSVDPVFRLLADLDHPARPTVEFQDALLARLLGELEDANRPELEAQASDRSHGRGSSILRPLRRRPGRMALAFAVVAVAAAIALFVSTPWTTSPGFLERAQAALTPPAGTILHYRSEATMTSTDPACTVRRGPNEFWIDQTPPHRFRAHLNDLPDPGAGADPRALVCSTGFLERSAARSAALRSRRSYSSRRTRWAARG